MDELILNFSHSQHKMYIELSSKVKTEKIDIDFDMDLLPTVAEVPMEDISSLIQSLISSAQALLTLQKQSSSFFSVQYSDKMLEKIKCTLRSTMGNILATKGKLVSIQARAAVELEEYEASHRKLEVAYSKFLPYKAALAPYPEYETKLSDIENAFTVAHGLYEIRIKARTLLLVKIEKLCEGIINVFLEKCSTALDPVTLEITDTELMFKYLREYMEQLKHI